MSSAQGQLAGIRGRRGRAGRPHAGRGSGAFRLRPGQVAAEARCRIQARRVAASGDAVGHAVLIASDLDGKWPIPQSLPVRMRSSPRA